MAAPSKAVRVGTSEVGVFRCPLCRSLVTGTVEVAVTLGDIVLENPTGTEPFEVVARAEASTHIRRLTVSHDCTGPANAAGNPDATDADET